MTYIMFNMQTSVQPIELLLQFIAQQYLSESYCLSVVTDKNLEANMLTYKTMAYISVNNDTEKLVQEILSVSEMGCSDYIVDMSQPELFMSAYVEAKKLGNARRPDKKIVIIFDEKNVDNFQNILEIEETALIRNILLIIPSNVTQECTLYDLITHKFVGNDAELNDPLYLDSWNSCTQEFEVNSNLFPHSNLDDLSGKILRVASVTYKPHVILDIDKSIAPLGHDGFEFRIVDQFCRWVNCTVEIIKDADEWGVLYKNGSGNGIVGNTANGPADIGLGSLYAWHDIYPFLDFSAPCVRSSITAVAPAPRILVSWELPLLAFTWEMWVTLFFTFVYATIALYIAQGFSADSIIMTTFGMMVTQSQNASDTNWRVRSVTGWVLVTGLVLDNAYGGGLAATFTVPRYEKVIDTIQDIVDSDMTWGARHDSWVWALTSSKEAKIIKLVSLFHRYDSDVLREKSFTRTMAFGVEKLNAGFFSFGDYLTEKAIEDLRLLQEDFYFGYTIVIGKKNSPYIDKITSLVGRLQNAGLLQAWETQVALKYLNYKEQLKLRISRVKKGVEIVPLGMKHVVGIFMVYSMGVAVSAMFFIVELVITQRKMKQKTELPKYF